MKVIFDSLTVGRHSKILCLPVAVTRFVDRRQLEPVGDCGGEVPDCVAGGVCRDLVVHVQPVRSARAVVLHLKVVPLDGQVALVFETPAQEGSSRIECFNGIDGNLGWL